MADATRPPKHLSALARQTWREVLEQWDLEPTGQKPLHVLLVCPVQ
ncbi:MAG TPA: hypothetical protein VMM35_03750 [Longimicrobiales bacterium]|nr:hypothetical protein [Longimicrobiales bacterium]